MLSRFLTLLQLSTANPAADSQEIVRHVTLLILFVVAVVLLFWGKKLLHVILFLFGLTGGLAIAIGTNNFFFHLQGVSLAVYTVVLALTGAVILSFALTFSFFLAGNTLAFFAFNSCKSLLPVSCRETWCLIVFCLLCGILATALKEQAIALFSAFGGSLIILDVLFSLIFQQDSLLFLQGGFGILDTATALIALLLLVLLTVVGTMYQLGKIKVRS